MSKGKRSLKRKDGFRKDRDMGKIKILLPLIVLLIILNLALGDDSWKDTNQSNFHHINVLIYSGSGTSDNCVYQIENCLEQANKENYISGVRFTYNTSNIINNNSLSGYDVVIMPGSSEGYDYLDNEDINESDLKNYIASGKGFLGICAGAYSGAEYTENWYSGWGVAPNVINQPYLETGNVTIKTTSAGNLENNDGEWISHINGPAMTTYSDVVTFATYDENSSYQGYAAIVGDHYGEGRSVLSGVHPELNPQHAEMLVNLIIWAYNGTYGNNTYNVTSN
jgi:glutamine amidotransferase-like uncharacterized protein